MIKTNNHRWAQLVAMGLANVPPQFNDTAILQWSNGGPINNNVIEHLQSYLLQQPQVVGPYEIHPYINRELHHFDLNRKYLLLGTFPPNSYLNNIPPLAAAAAANANVGPAPVLDFYYGNMAFLWQFFGVQLNPIAINTYLTDNSIAISDAVLGTQRRSFTSSADSALYNILPNHFLCKVISPASKIQNILTTSGKLKHINFRNSGDIRVSAINTLKIFIQIIKNTCNNKFTINGTPDGSGPYHPLTNAGIAAAIQQQKSVLRNGVLQPDQFSHIIWNIKHEEKKYRIINLPAPPDNLTIIGSDFFYRWLRYKALINGLPAPPIQGRNQFMNLFPNAFQPPFSSQYKSEVYQMAINNLPTLISL